MELTVSRRGSGNAYLAVQVAAATRPAPEADVGVRATEGVGARDTGIGEDRILAAQETVPHRRRRLERRADLRPRRFALPLHRATVAVRVAEVRAVSARHACEADTGDPH